MGGGNALAAAAADPRVAAPISQVPFLVLSQAYRSAMRVRLRMLLAAALGRHLPAVGQRDEAAGPPRH
jgi:cephalosporin-C deacetylase-like acetyl esterase